MFDRHVNGHVDKWETRWATRCKNIENFLFKNVKNKCIRELYYTYDNFCVVKIKYIMYKIEDSSILCSTQLYVRVSILLTCHCGKHLHDHIILLIREVWYITSLTPPSCIEVSVPGRLVVLYICAMGIDFCLCFYYFAIGFSIVPLKWYFPPFYA